MNIPHQLGEWMLWFYGTILVIFAILWIFKK